MVKIENIIKLSFHKFYVQSQKLSIIKKTIISEKWNIISSKINYFKKSV